MAFSESSLPLPEISVPQAVVEDYDRTLGDVNASFQRFMLTATALGVEAGHITEARARVENDGGSFAPFGTIQPLLEQVHPPAGQDPDKALETFCDKYIALSGPELLYDDVPLFQHLLGVNHLPNVIATYGVEQLWQALKIRTSRLQGYCEFMNHTDKGLLIEQWRQPTGTFDFVAMRDDEALAIYRAKSVCLIDDKAKAFKSLPEDCSGYLIQRSETLLPSQQGAIPPSVKAIRSLGDLCIEDGCLVTAASAHAPITQTAPHTAGASYQHPEEAETSVQYVPLGNALLAAT